MSTQITAEDLIAVSRRGAAALRIGQWELTRARLVSQLGKDAWIMAGREKVELIPEAARLVADDMNTGRPWEATNTGQPHELLPSRVGHWRSRVQS